MPTLATEGVNLSVVVAKLVEKLFTSNAITPADYDDIVVGSNTTYAS